MRRPTSSLATRAPIIAGWMLGLGCFAYLMSLPPTLNRADESYILYEAKRVLQGQALYRDFFDFLAPGSFYFYALAYALGGTSITSARTATSLLHALGVVSTYFLALRVASAAEAVVAGLLVAVICVPVWNMASHHWIATAFGLATAAVLLAPGWQGSSRLRPAAAGALAGLVLCTHQARGAWLIAWLGVATVLLALRRTETRRWRRCLGEMLWTAAGGAAVCVPILGYAVWHSSLGEMWYATYTFVNTRYRRANVGPGSHGFGSVRWAAHSPLTGGGVRYTYLWLLESIPVLLAVEAATLMWAMWRSGPRSQLLRAALVLLALSAIGGIAYFPGLAHVAFVTPFALPVLAGIAYRTRKAAALSRIPAGRGAVRLAWTAVLVVVLAKGWSNYRLLWNGNPELYPTAFGTLAGSRQTRDLLRELRRKLPTDGPTPPRLLAYPMDAWLYLALPADNPTPFCLLRPGYNTPGQFETAIERLDRDPRAFVLVNVLLGSGKRRDAAFSAYLRTHFHEIARLGPAGQWKMRLYRLYARNGQD
jgi:4-amino-4-deoxy-L-arabinose transferase-like glycosyltransferase